MSINFWIIYGFRFNKKDYRYKDSTIEKFGRIFSEEHIKTYSMKIYNILSEIKKSKGIVKKNPIDKNDVHKDIQEVLQIGHTKQMKANLRRFNA